MRIREIALTLLIAGASSNALAERPNVLFIPVDDLRTELGCYGVEHIQSPNIDRLAAGGTTFLRAYCQQAVCSPSRTSLMTGLRPDSTHVYDLETHFRTNVADVITLAQHFKNNGYYCLSMGKIYHPGLDDPPSWSEPARRPQTRAGYVNPGNLRIIERKRREGQRQGLKGKDLWRKARGEPFERGEADSDDAYFDGSLANLGVAALAELKQKRQPFFLAVGFLKPHLPFNCPAHYWDLYDPASIRLADNAFPPAGAPKMALTSWGELRAYEGMPQKGDLTEAQARTLRHAYYACVSYTDANIGKLLDALEALDLAKNTIVVLWGDHGWKLGEHNGWCKHTNFENDAQAPLIIRAPGQKAPGGRTRALTEFVDIYPSLCDLAGLEKPQHLEGQSMARYLDQPDAPGPETACSQYPRGKTMGYSVRTDRYRCTIWRDRRSGHIAAAELYDHQADPQENVNVANRPENKELVNRLTATIRREFHLD